MTNEQQTKMLAALRAVRSGATREMGRDSGDQAYAHIRMASLEKVLATLAEIEADDENEQAGKEAYSGLQL